MMRHVLKLLPLVSLYLLVACSSVPGSAPGVLQSALTGDFFPQPDPRDCLFPNCGGIFLIAPNTTNPCYDFAFNEPYVTGVFQREPDGTLTPRYPACNQLITGSTEPDPMYPGFEIFVLSP